MGLLKRSVIIILFVIMLFILLLIINNQNKVTKDSIINSFNHDFNAFNNVMKYLIDDNSSIIAYSDNGKVVVTDTETMNSSKLPINKQIEYIIKKLKYE